MAKRDEYTTEIDALETLDDFDDAEEELDGDDLGPDLETDLDDDLDGDLDPVLDAVDLVEDLGIVDDLSDEPVAVPEVKKLEDDDEEALDDEDEEDEEGEEALDVLLLTRDAGLDDDVRLDDEPRAGLSNSDAPIGAGEFTCRSCFLVKRRPQLADPDLMICFDCM